MQEHMSSDPHDLYDEGVYLFENGDTIGAIALFERLIGVDPHYALGYYRLGLCYISTGDTARAKGHLRRFIELAPGDPEAASARDMLSYL